MATAKTAQRSHPRAVGGLAAASLILLLAACLTESAAPAASVATAGPQGAQTQVASASLIGTLAEARSCGAALGTAARCNFIQDDREFSLLRTQALQTLGGGALSAAERGEVAMAFDSAAIEQLYAVETCQIPESQVPQFEAYVEQALSPCVGAGPR